MSKQASPADGVVRRPEPELTGRQANLQREARVAGLRDFTSPTLESVERRRWQLWFIAGFMLVALSAGMVLLSLDDVAALRLEFLPLYAIRTLLIGFSTLIALYLVDKEYRLRKLTHILIDERVLNAALSNRLKEVSLLSEVGKAINRLLDLEDVLQMILDSAIDLLEAEEGSIMLLDETSERLNVAFARTERQDLVKGASTPLGKGIAGWVAQNREPLLISGRVPHGLFADFREKEREIASAICVPLIGGEEIFGVLNVNDLSGTREFTEYELRALGLFAEHAAIAIRNARAYEQERQAISRLREVDRMKTDFVATVSHELRSPLTAIIGSARTLLTRSDELSTEDRYEFLEVIERQGNRLLRVIEEILSAARIESGHTLRRDPFDLVEVTRSTIQGFESAGAKCPITIESPASLTAYGDQGAVEQILTNLVDNAVKHSEADSPVKIRLAEEPGVIRIEVIDRGRGVPADALLTIFERFRQVEPHSTRRGGGVGLGLYIVKNLVSASGGDVSVESREGEGSTFTVTLPRRKEEG